MDIMENSRKINIIGTIIWYYYFGLGMMTGIDLPIIGTIIWYCYVCPLKVWLMARHINPDEDDHNVGLWIFVHTKKGDWLGLEPSILCSQLNYVGIYYFWYSLKMEIENFFA